MRKVQISEQVADYVRQLPPIPKKRIRSALKSLEQLEGDLKDLEEPLDRYTRLRIYQFRVILSIEPDKIVCIFIERRSIVYEVFESNFLR
jgi:mRNA-degrading endonuclease RelE of RelBE toxin-antitoxin system